MAAAAPGAVDPLRVAGLQAGYGAAEQILKGVSLAVHPSEIVSIIGPNGAGKSTFLKAVAGLAETSEGTVTASGEDVTRLGPQARARLGLTLILQERNVFGSLTVAENLLVSAFEGAPKARARRDELYARYPMLADRRRQLARTLSGGQRQVLAVAMGLIVQPKLLLLDEPTAGLSPKAADELFDMIVALNRDGMAILMVEQHALEALEISARGYVLAGGRNLADGAGPALAADPEIRRLFLGG